MLWLASWEPLNILLEEKKKIPRMVMITLGKPAEDSKRSARLPLNEEGRLLLRPRDAHFNCYVSVK